MSKNSAHLKKYEIVQIFSKYVIFSKFLLHKLIFTLHFCFKEAQRVLLRDVTSITLNRGVYTNGRRSAPVPQLQCTGGTANGKYAPKTVQCYNRGFDGVDVQWECKADMPLDYQFGKVNVLTNFVFKRASCLLIN